MSYQQNRKVLIVILSFCFFRFILDCQRREKQDSLSIFKCIERKKKRGVWGRGSVFFFVFQSSLNFGRPTRIPSFFFPEWFSSSAMTFWTETFLFSGEGGEFKRFDRAGAHSHLFYIKKKKEMKCHIEGLSIQEHLVCSPSRKEERKGSLCFI